MCQFTGFLKPIVLLEFRLTWAIVRGHSRCVISAICLTNKVGNCLVTLRPTLTQDAFHPNFGVADVGSANNICCFSTISSRRTVTPTRGKTSKIKSCLNVSLADVEAEAPGLPTGSNIKLE